MKTITPLSWLRQAIAALMVALLAASPAFAGTKYASIVIDLDTAQVLHSRDADESRHPASLTKVMTLYLVFDALDSGKLKLTDRLKVSKLASRQQPSKLGLKANSTIKVEDAIRALVTKSANDVAVVLAEKLGGSQDKFVIKMNAKAKELGMEHTVFRNASGLPDAKQVTTARDMAKLAEAVYFDHKDRYNYFSLPSFTWNKRKYANHNELLRKVDGVDGIKTGFTNASGYNLMASAQRGGHRVIAVMLGGTTGKSRDQHVADLLEAAFLEISGAPADQIALAKSRLDYNDKIITGADALALAQLRKLNEPEDAALVSSNDPALVAEAEGTTDEDDDGVAVSENDGDLDDGALQAKLEAAGTPITVPDYTAAPVDPAAVAMPVAAAQTPALAPAQPDPIGALIAASPAPADAVLVTSQAPAEGSPSATSLSQLALPVSAN